MKGRLIAAALLPVIGLVVGAAPAAAIQTSAPAAESPPPPLPRDTDAPADRFGFVEGEQLQISTGTDDDKLTFRAALPTGPSMASRFALSMSTPLHGGDNAMPASLDALANGSRVTLSWGYFDLRVGRPDAIWARIRDRARRRCMAAEPAPDPTEDRCMDSNYAMVRYDPENRPLEQRRTSPGATDFGIDATVGINDFEWVDPVTLTPQKARRTDWSIAGHVARYLPGSHTAFTGSVSYQRAYEAVDEQLLCPPAVVDPATQCINARGGAPGRNENLLLSAGVRHRFSAGTALLNLALAPVATYDVIDDVWGVDVPVYIMPDADGNLTGGIRFGYRSDRENEFTIGVFVGAAFNILN